MNIHSCKTLRDVFAWENGKWEGFVKEAVKWKVDTYFWLLVVIWFNVWNTALSIFSIFYKTFLAVFLSVIFVFRHLGIESLSSFVKQPNSTILISRLLQLLLQLKQFRETDSNFHRVSHLGNNACGFRRFTRLFPDRDDLYQPRHVSFNFFNVFCKGKVTANKKIFV